MEYHSPFYSHSPTSRSFPLNTSVNLLQMFRSLARVSSSTARLFRVERSLHTSRVSNEMRPLGPLSALPQFKAQAVVDGDFKTVSHTDYTGKWLLFFFYPLDFTFVCPTEIIAFSDRAKEFRDIGCEVVACSCDSHFSHLAWTEKDRNEGGLGEMKIPLIADFNKNIARSFGVLDESMGLSFRGLFLSDPNGKIRHVTVNDLPVGRSVDEALRVLKAFQFVEKHGEVCPADWKEEGDATIKPSIKGSKEYFNKVNK